MVIAVNTRLLLPQLEGIGYFIYENFKRIIADHPEHEFIFLFDRPYDTRFVFGKNVKAVIAGPPARHPLLWKIWYDIRIPSLLKKYKADIFVSCDGFCSLRTRVPQCLVVHDLSFLHDPAFMKRSHYLFLKRYTPKFIQKARRIVTVSAFSKNDIISKYNTTAEKIDVVYNGVKDSFHPSGEEDITAIKDRYTSGKEFFLYTGAIHPRKNLLTLLKAFSVFKKRQQTGMKLLLTGRLAWKYDSFVKDLKSYKYRDDVVMTGYIDEQELVKLMGAAYGLVYPSLFEGFGVPVLEAMRCDVPVITSAGSAMQEIAKDAALYADVTNHTSLADKMMLLYKDENGRKALIQKGRAVAAVYSWEKTAELLWESILKTVDAK